MAIIRANNNTLSSVTALPFATGGLVKLKTTDVTSAQATVTFDNTVITDTYDKYILSYQGLSPVSNGAYYRTRYSDDNGSSFKTGTFNYGYHYTRLGGVGTSGTGNTKSDYATSDYACSSAIDDHSSGMFSIDCLRDATLDLHIRNEFIQKTTGGGQYYYVSQEGWHYSKSFTLNYIEFSFNTGNIADGTFTLYGLAK